MKRALHILLRTVRLSLQTAGVLALIALLLQFTPLPWRAYKWLSQCPDPSAREPTHILVMGGSGIPGKSGLMRTHYGAEAAALHPGAQLLVAMPLGADESAASRVYLDELALRGVPTNRMSVLPQGRNTREQALRLAAHLGNQAPHATVLIISCPEHIRRTAAALRKTGVNNLAGLPAFALSIEDPLPWRAAELKKLPADSTPAPAPAQRLPEVGHNMILRYNLWNNLYYTLDSLREAAALAYYRLNNWI